MNELERKLKAESQKIIENEAQGRPLRAYCGYSVGEIAYLGLQEASAEVLQRSEGAVKAAKTRFFSKDNLRRRENFRKSGIAEEQITRILGEEVNIYALLDKVLKDVKAIQKLLKASPEEPEPRRLKNFREEQTEHSKNPWEFSVAEDEPIDDLDY